MGHDTLSPRFSRSVCCPRHLCHDKTACSTVQPCCANHPHTTPSDAHGEAKVAYPWQAPTDPASWKEEHVVFTVLAGWVVGIWSATKIFGGGKKEAPLVKAADAAVATAADAAAQQVAAVAAAVAAAPAAPAAAPAVVTSAAVSEPVLVVPAAPAAGKK